jgi:SPP1 family predicted phage head-tail adaptor
MPSLKSPVGNKKSVSLDDVCYLLTVTTVGKDELDQSIEAIQERPVFCTKTSISRAEFVGAGQLGYKPKIQILINSDEYDEETKLKYEDKLYSVYKTFMRDDGYTELYCEVKLGG